MARRLHHKAPEVYRDMKQFIPVTVILAGALIGSGCATKKFVRQTVDPVSGKLDTVAQQSTQQGQKIDQTSQTLDQTRQTLEKDETELSATKERAMSADSRAGDALNKAGEASAKADQANRDLGELRNTVANLDDYKQVAETTLNFKFNSDKLTPDAKQGLDQMVANQGQYKRFFVAVEGFTDRVGSVEYNAALSRRRADAVVEYLVAQHNIPIYRIHMVGLGKMKPVEEGNTRAAGAKNRRVEVTLFSADQGAMAMTAKPSDSNSTSARPGNQTSQQ
ncbi:MAG: OmpA family protein [Acidobacteriota bacterium]|nr:OmpA family protein [Acidobacteriota bacterium]